MFYTQDEQIKLRSAWLDGEEMRNMLEISGTCLIDLITFNVIKVGAR